MCTSPWRSSDVLIAVDPSFCSLEVILKDASNPFEPMEVARKELPYFFDVRPSKPRVKEPTRTSDRDQTQPTTIGALSNIRCGAEYPGPATTPSPPPRERLGQRTNGHVSSVDEYETPSNVQRLPSAIPVFRAQAPSPGGSASMWLVLRGRWR